MGFYNQTKPLHQYIENGPTLYQFLSDLHNINLMLSPIARGLKTLEGQNSTCSDVFNIYIGIAIGYNNVFRDAGKSTDVVHGLKELRCDINIYCIASPVYQWRSQTFGVYNRRFANLMRDSTQDMFLLAYLLDPSKPI